MKELSLHILDIVQNSLRAGASLVQIVVTIDTRQDFLRLKIEDNGCGMTEDFLQQVTDPFTTTRTTRKVGLGIPLLKEAAERTGGHFIIQSQVGVGTMVEANFVYRHIDCMPLGDMASTMMILIQGSPEVDFIYEYSFNERSFLLKTAELREILQHVPLDEPQVLKWIHDFVQENEGLVREGNVNENN